MGNLFNRLKNAKTKVAKEAELDDKGQVKRDAKGEAIYKTTRTVSRGVLSMIKRDQSFRKKSPQTTKETNKKFRRELEKLGFTKIKLEDGAIVRMQHAGGTDGYAVALLKAIDAKVMKAPPKDVMENVFKAAVAAKARINSAKTEEAT